MFIENTASIVAASNCVLRWINACCDNGNSSGCNAVLIAWQIEQKLPNLQRKCINNAKWANVVEVNCNVLIRCRQVDDGYDDGYDEMRNLKTAKSIRQIYYMQECCEVGDIDFKLNMYMCKIIYKEFRFDFICLTLGNSSIHYLNNELNSEGPCLIYIDKCI